MSSVKLFFDLSQLSALSTKGLIAEEYVAPLGALFSKSPHLIGKVNL
jgi:hypothetical protein